MHGADALSRPNVLYVMRQAVSGSLIAQTVANGRSGVTDGFIGLSPCCPPLPSSSSTKASRLGLGKRLNFWFKVVDQEMYMRWDWTQASRAREVEVLITRLLASVCAELPVDGRRIYFVGCSLGGYGVLRLGELLPKLPSAIVSIGGYYPEINGHDHDASVLAERLKDVPKLWALHCRADEFCRPDRKEVQRIFDLLKKKNSKGFELEWVPPAAGGRWYPAKQHEATGRSAWGNPTEFFSKLLSWQRTEPTMGASAYCLQCAHAVESAALRA